MADTAEDEGCSNLVLFPWGLQFTGKGYLKFPFISGPGLDDVFCFLCVTVNLLLLKCYDRVGAHHVLSLDQTRFIGLNSTKLCITIS